MEWKTERQLVNEVRGLAMIRQSIEAIESKTPEKLDTVSIDKGIWSKFNAGLDELATELGFDNNKYPRQNVSSLLKTATKRYVRSYCIMLLANKALGFGVADEDLDDTVLEILETALSTGLTYEEILENLIND